MADTVNTSPVSSGPIDSGTSSDYETKAMDILAEDSGEGESETPEDTPEEVPEEIPEEEEAPPQEEEEDAQEEEGEEEEEPEEKPVPDELLTLSGKEAYEKLKKDYPDAIKNNPALRQVFFREKAFSDIYSSVEEARNAAHAYEILGAVNADLDRGNVLPVLSSLSPKAKEHLAEHFIASLHQMDKNLFIRATGPFLSNIINDAYEYGKERKNENLMNATLVLSKFLTGKYELPRRSLPMREDPALKAEREAFEAEKRNFFGNQVHGFLDGADKVTDVELDKIIRNGLDPDNRMSKFLRNAIVRSTVDEIRAYVDKDPAFQGHMKDLFVRAQKDGFSQASKSRIVSAYLGRVKDIALKIRASKRAEALKTSREDTPETKRPQPYRRPVQRTPERQPGKRMTELDIIRAR